ncbi:MAG: pyruvate/2-oxoglutarate dehydrogenase complex [Candidatus Dadabacteria bacterium CSP1-2]|nr:MAG: pyruvate/2-oxoglutarate dehydrogenase complex [Candidatus Dadabacteria bacterium CSP1-2]
MKEYDIIIIGAGSGGLNIAGFMNRAGFKVLLIDKSDERIGGDCLNSGCVPSKALIHVARLLKDANEASRFGLTVNGKADIKKVLGYVKEKQEVIRVHENAEHFRKIGMDVVLGEARFAGPDSVTVGNETYRGKKIILATGSRPRKLDVPGIEKVKYETNETIFDLDKLPDHLVVIGGGPIGIELGQAFRHLGSKVTVVEMDTKFLPKESPEIADVLRRRLESEGISFIFNATVKEFTSPNQAVIVNKDKKEIRIDFDTMLVSIGRDYNINGLSLEKADIELDETGKRLKVDEHLRTTNKRVYVSGDVAGSYQFTHAAEVHAGVIINNFFSPFKKKLNNDHMAWVTYTTPEIATFGLNEEELKKRGISYEKIVFDFNEDDRAIVDEAQDGKLLLFIAKDKILGGSMVAENAGELSQELILANSSGLKLKHIFGKVYPYPTASRVNKRIISLYYANKLTPFAKRVLHLFYG